MLYMFNSINKNIDFEKDLLASKTLQILITLINQLHQEKRKARQNLFQREQHLKLLFDGCLTIVEVFLQNLVNKKQSMRDEIVSRMNLKADLNPAQAENVNN